MRRLGKPHPQGSLTLGRVLRRRFPVQSRLPTGTSLDRRMSLAVVAWKCRTKHDPIFGLVASNIY